MKEDGVRRRQGRPTIEEAVALRETFLNQAFAMLCERGVYGFSIDALAKSSDVTKRTIYRQFESKSALIEAVVEREARRLTDNGDLPLDSSVAPLEHLRLWADKIFRYFVREDVRRFDLLLRGASLTEAWAAEILDAWTIRVLDVGRGLVVAAQRSGSLRAGDAEILLSLLLDLIGGERVRYDATVSGRLCDADMDRSFTARWLAFLHLARPDWISG